MLRESLSGRKAGRRMFRLHARSILDVPSTTPKPTRVLEAPVSAPAPVTFCLGLWRLVRKSLVRWWLRLWAYQPNTLRSRWRETWIFEARLAYQKTCPSALRAFIFILMLLLLRQPRNNCADCAKRRSNIV